ncbi:MAG: DUF2207 domain-containing protein [Calditrichaeota bacterium]|nr:DUF2207 domain-containing protein [Calditrichota bacterium]
MHRKLFQQNLFVMFVFFFIAFAWSFSASFAVSKFYTLDEIQIAARINEDGSLNIKENRSYNFRGHYKWADYSLPLRELGEVTDFSLSEGNEIYRESNSHEPGTYFITQSSNKFYVKWFYRASFEKRTFTIRYRLANAVKVYRDVADFYFKFVAAKKPKRVGRVSLDLVLPQAADTTEVRAWLHTSLNGFYYFANGKIHFEAAPLPKKNFFEVRAIFPPEWVPAANVKIDKNYRMFIMAEERGFAEKANRLRQKAMQERNFREKYAPKAKQLNILLVIIGAILFINLYNRYGKAYSIPGLSRVSSEIPDNMSPATANLIISNGQLTTGALTGTLLDLAARGYLKMDEKVEDRKALFFKYKFKTQTLTLDREKFEKESGELLPHDREFIEFFFNDLAGGQNSINTDEIRKHRREVMKWFRQWRKNLKQEWGNKPFYDKPSIWATVAIALFGLLIIGVGIFTLIKFSIWGIVGIAGGFVLSDASFFILRYTKETKAIRMRLESLKKYLKKYEYRKSASAIQSNFSRYFAMAIALGIGAKAVKELIKFAVEDPSRNYFPYYYSSLGHTSPMEFSKSMSSFISSISTSMASAAGTGGGASAGGGGGAGGAAGGAG